MDMTLSPSDRELQARARAYVSDVLRPLEDEFERAGGRLSRKEGADLRRAAIEARLHGGSLPREIGGQGWTVTDAPKPMLSGTNRLLSSIWFQNCLSSLLA